MDTFFNGVAHGDVAERLMQCNFDPGALRPFIGNDGRSYITINSQGSQPQVVPVHNATATLRRLDWIKYDEAIVKAALLRLRAVADLRGAGLQYNIPNGMANTVLQYEAQSDISGATISMDGMKRGESDRPLYDLRNLPLPIIHKDFQINLRQLMASRNGGSPLDTTMAELAGRKVAEEAEQLLLGTLPSYAFGGGTLYGYTNFPYRITKTLTKPTAVGWTPATTLAEVLDMKHLSQAAKHFGPWFCYCSPGWDEYLDNDYSTNTGTMPLTLRNRLQMIQGIGEVATLDYLPDYTFLLVQKTSDVAREVIGMDVQTVQWESSGGMLLNYKVMCIMVPQLRQDFNGNTGIVHGYIAP